MRHTILSPVVPLLALALVSCTGADTPVGLPANAGPLQADAAALSPTDVSLMFDDIALHTGGVADIHVRLFVDEAAPGQSCSVHKTAVAVPGYAHTAQTWSAFAEAVFANYPSQICRVAAIDFPGHGGSPTLAGFPLLTLDDYASVVLGVIDRLGQQGLEPTALIGHSQGGMVVQIAQQRLVANGSSLRDALGIKEVTLLAPTMPNALPWVFVENGTAAGLIGGFCQPAAPPNCTHVAIPDFIWPFVFFSRFSDGTPVSNAPNGAGLNAPEPIIVTLQLVGALPPGRPAIDAGIFSGQHGSQLSVIAFAEDQIVRPGEAAALFAYLTGGNNGGKFAVVEGSESVHDMYISNPAALLRSIHLNVP
jgi:pimeloyl-ACP methyl ester carboxylesterase